VFEQNGKECIKECLSVHKGYGIGIITFSTEKGKGEGQE
jgi:hypothetical protein